MSHGIKKVAAFLTDEVHAIVTEAAKASKMTVEEFVGKAVEATARHATARQEEARASAVATEAAHTELDRQEAGLPPAAEAAKPAFHPAVPHTCRHFVTDPPLHFQAGHSFNGSCALLGNKVCPFAPQNARLCDYFQSRRAVPGASTLPTRIGNG